MLFSGSGTAAVEAAVCSVVPRDRALLVVSNGVYGDRLVRIARVHGIPAEVLAYDVTTPVPPADVEAALRARPELSHVAVVHHETTTGLLNPVMDVARVAARAGRRVLIDAMSSLFGERLDVDADGVDFVMASANKCLQGVPGIAFVLGRRSALDALAGQPPRSVYLDLHGHYTDPGAGQHALHAGRPGPPRDAAGPRRAGGGGGGRPDRPLRGERPGAAARHGRARLRDPRPRGARSSILTTFRLLPGLAYDPLHDAMKRRGYVIYAGQGDIRTYAFRVSNMGTLTPRDMEGVVDAFRASLAELAVGGQPDPEA